MVSEREKGEVPPMTPEEIMATLFSMREIIDDLYRRVYNTGDEESSVKDEGGGEVGGPSKPSSPSSASSSSSGASKNYSHKKKPSNKSSHNHDFPLLKLDVKFELSIYDG
jgi:hypothetical protein